MLKEAVYHVPLMDLMALTVLINCQFFFLVPSYPSRYCSVSKTIQVIGNVYLRLLTTFHLEKLLPSVKVILRPHHQKRLRIDYNRRYQYQLVLNRPVLQLGGPESIVSVTVTISSSFERTASPAHYQLTYRD